MRTKWVSFYKGRMIPDETLRLILDQAERGKMTKAARKLLLVPDTRYGDPDGSGLQMMRPVQRKDCVTLAWYARKNRPTKTPKRQKTTF